MINFVIENALIWGSKLNILGLTGLLLGQTLLPIDETAGQLITEVASTSIAVSILLFVCYWLAKQYTSERKKNDEMKDKLFEHSMKTTDTVEEIEKAFVEKMQRLEDKIEQLRDKNQS